MKDGRQNIKGRGAGSNTINRFERTHVIFEPHDSCENDEAPLLRTQLFKDTSKTIIAENKSPDIPFVYSVNPYRGCEHGCSYCYARPTHEYLGFSAGLDFESKILIKERAPELLREHFLRPSWKGDALTFSGNTDCYQPLERTLKITRGCLEVCAEFLNPVSLITKNALITRDIDILQSLAGIGAATATISITTLDDDLCAKLEPRASRPAARLKTIGELAKAGIPVSVNVAPCIPGLTDHEMPTILKAAKDAGATGAGFTALRLPLAVAPLFEEWLDTHRPQRKSKVLSQIKDLRGGKLNDSRFGSRMRGQGPIAENLKQMFSIYTEKFGLNRSRRTALNSSGFRRPGDQLNFNLER